jgi:hypothetical protein
VRVKPVHAATSVIAHLEHRVDTVLGNVPDIPRLEPRAGRERCGLMFAGFPLAWLSSTMTSVAPPARSPSQAAATST